MSALGEDDDLRFEDRSGTAGRLQPSERVIWQGSPDWRALAVSAFHVRKVAAYFALVIVWQAVAATGSPLVPAAGLVAACVLAVGILLALAFAYAKCTVYTLTTRRLVIRSGVALPVTFNLPLGQIEKADLAVGRDGTGTVSFTIAKPNRVALLAVWPNARPWRFSNPEPALRAIPDAARTARLIAEALRVQAGDAGITTAPTVATAAGSPMPAGIAAGMAA